MFSLFFISNPKLERKFMNPKFIKRIVAHYIREREVPYFGPIHDPGEVVKYFRFLEIRDREEFVSLHLDKGNRPICWDRISVGTLNETYIHPREVYKTALLSNASALIFMHNHPSGRTEPSSEDHAITKKLIEAAKILEIKILDHLIIGEGSYFSFQEHGLIKNQ